jgi:hypothetical protein
LPALQVPVVVVVQPQAKKPRIEPHAGLLALVAPVVAVALLLVKKRLTGTQLPVSHPAAQKAAYPVVSA